MQGQSSLRQRAAFLAIVLAVAAAALQAHTKLQKSEPAAGATVTVAPKQIQLWFNEKIDPAVSKVELSGPSGKVELGAVHVMNGRQLMAPVAAALPGGAYKVAWQAAGDDGHVAKGEFAFNVKTAAH